MIDSSVTRGQRALSDPVRLLQDLAYNLWWTWHPQAERLFERMDPVAWERVGHNPVALLQDSTPEQRMQLAADPGFLDELAKVSAAFDAYLAGNDRTWFAQTYPGDHDVIAYFCMEYGLHESLPLYAGGLGILAGDHCKTASDLGLPFVAVGLWYAHGYFHQRVTTAGLQVAEPELLTQASAPLLPAREHGQDLVLEVPLLDRNVLVRVWRVQVGRVPLLLLDTDVDGNTTADRAICANLYGGDRETRLQQELVLGLGGVRALRALGINPTRWHMNEGHAGFMALERIREYVQHGVPFEEAWPLTADATLFTTHTPVPAGNEVFKTALVQEYLAAFPAEMHLDMHGFLALAKEDGALDGTFAMTPLALRMSHHANGVSALHGAVARAMWAKQFPDRPASAVPIGAITNGVHSATWVAPELRALFDRYLGGSWLDRVDDPELWTLLARMPDAELWGVHVALKEKLIAFAGAQAAARADVARPLQPQAFTIGFARRFATYKRATLFFHDLDRAVKILTDRRRPVQIVFAGKAHPADGGGQALIRSLVELSGKPELAGHVTFLEGYDMDVARYLVQGCDLWLNNPERPQEASGTSGQKAALNGVPNCSIRDGWWDEGFNGKNGWAFGGEVGDVEVDSAQLYEVLEQSILPAFFTHRRNGRSRAWLAVMREAIRTCAPAFSAQRMLKEYTQTMYRPR